MADPLTREELDAFQNLMLADIETSMGWSKAFKVVSNAIDARALAKRPLPKSFEVHHEVCVARDAVVRAALAGKTIDEGMADARKAVSLDPA